MLTDGHAGVLEEEQWRRGETHIGAAELVAEVGTLSHESHLGHAIIEFASAAYSALLTLLLLTVAGKTPKRSEAQWSTDRRRRVCENTRRCKAV